MKATYYFYIPSHFKCNQLRFFKENNYLNDKCRGVCRRLVLYFVVLTRAAPECNTSYVYIQLQ